MYLVLHPYKRTFFETGTEAGDVTVQMNILKMMAVCLVFYTAFRRPGNGHLTFVIVSLIIPGSLFAYWLDGGINGIAFSLSGMLVAAVGASAYYLARRLSPVEYIITIAIGSIVGPAGIFFLFLIVFALNMAQKLLGADTTVVKDRYEKYSEKEKTLDTDPESRRSRQSILPWRTKLALATLSILISGIFI